MSNVACHLDWFSVGCAAMMFLAVLYTRGIHSALKRLLGVNEYLCLNQIRGTKKLV